jgi:hypothetical protein
MANKPESIEQAREWLDAVGEFLSRVPHASNRLQYVARAISEYLVGNGKLTLGQAFGLERRVGAPKSECRERPGARLALACKAVRLWHGGKSWNEIGDELGCEDVRELRRIWAENCDAAIRHYANELAERIKLELADDRAMQAPKREGE